MDGMGQGTLVRLKVSAKAGPSAYNRIVPVALENRVIECDP
jgi:hypothetical protein